MSSRHWLRNVAQYLARASVQAPFGPSGLGAGASEAAMLNEMVSKGKLLTEP